MKIVKTITKSTARGFWKQSLSGVNFPKNYKLKLTFTDQEIFRIAPCTFKTDNTFVAYLNKKDVDKNFAELSSEDYKFVSDIEGIEVYKIENKKEIAKKSRQIKYSIAKVKKSKLKNTIYLQKNNIFDTSLPDIKTWKSLQGAEKFLKSNYFTINEFKIVSL